MFLRLTIESFNNNDYDIFLTCVKESGISSMCKLQNCFVVGSDCQVIPKYLSIASVYLNGGVNRVHGGGFAGTILNIVKNDNLERFICSVSKHFGSKNILPLRVRSCGAKDLWFTNKTNYIMSHIIIITNKNFIDYISK